MSINYSQIPINHSRKSPYLHTHKISMIKDQRIVSPGPKGKITNEYGELESPPKGWSFLPAGDAGITRKVTSKKKFWRVQVKKGRRTISKGIWAPSETIAWAKQEVEKTRSTEQYAKKQEQAKKYRQKKQDAYEVEFCNAVKSYLRFHSKHEKWQNLMAYAITKHAVPVGSGTVARTSMIPIEQRAAKAVIAWMRHQTTAYDNLQISKVNGKRREIRKMLAEQSSQLLGKYRRGEEIAHSCPLKSSLRLKQESSEFIK